MSLPDVEPVVESGLAIYPERVAVGGHSKGTIGFLATTGARVVAEVGCYKGHTSEQIARLIGEEGELHLFDFADRVDQVVERLGALGYSNIVPHANSHQILDSYNWSLMRVVEQSEEPLFDYVFLDGAHIWAHDALAFCLIDRLLKPGGYIDFDDYNWTLASSPSMKPAVFPMTASLYTQEQIAARQVALVVNLLVRRDPRYREVVRNKIFQKLPLSDSGEAPVAKPASSTPAKPDAGAPLAARMSAEEIALFQAAIKGKKCAVEFGTGGSTFLLVAAGIERIISIDSDERWIQKLTQHAIIKPHIESGRLAFRHVDIGPTKAWGYPTDDQRKKDWPHYWKSPWRKIDPSAVDLVVIDGRFRIACGLNALLRGNDAMTVIVHDFWSRPEYHVMLKYMNSAARAGSLAVLFPKRSIDRKAVRADLKRHVAAVN